MKKKNKPSNRKVDAKTKGNNLDIILGDIGLDESYLDPKNQKLRIGKSSMKKKPSYREVYEKTKCKTLDVVDQKRSSGHKLSLSWDFDFDASKKDQWRAVFLSIPNKEQHQHEHMEMTHKKAKELRDWLNSFLREVDTYKRNKKKKSVAKKQNSKK